MATPHGLPQHLSGPFLPSVQHGHSLLGPRLTTHLTARVGARAGVGRPLSVPLHYVPGLIRAQELADCVDDIADVSNCTSGALRPHLDAGMTAQVEVKLSRVGDFRVHGCACWNVSTLPNLWPHKSLIRHGRVSRTQQAR